MNTSTAVAHLPTEAQPTSNRWAARQREVLAVAQECMKRLVSEYGAKRVLLCGSAAGQSPWHRESDLDLAVEGLSVEMLELAEDELLTRLPDWLALDLIPLERVHPEVRRRLLEGTMAETSLFAELKNRLEDEIKALRRVQAGLTTALKRIQAEPLDEFATRALATYVEDFYTGCERICERIAVALDSGLPQGSDWHRTLLGNMADPGGYTRPPLFSGELLLELDDYRRFRHRARRRYGHELDPERVLVLAQGIEPVLQRVQEAVDKFNQWLDQQ
jgi:predicted nucleotidyltransferase